MFQNFFPPFSSFFNSFRRFFSEISSNQSKVYGDIFICLQTIMFIGSDLVNQTPCGEDTFSRETLFSGKPYFSGETYFWGETFFPGRHFPGETDY